MTWSVDDACTLDEPATFGRVERWQALTMFACILFCFLFVSLLHRLIRTYVYFDAHLLGTLLDGGADHNSLMIACGLVASVSGVAVVSQSTARFLSFGVSGGFGSAAAPAVALSVLAIAAIEVRVKAPGAKTYLQVVRVRFGAKCHVVAVGFALALSCLLAAEICSAAVVQLTSACGELGKEVMTLLLVAGVLAVCVPSGVGGFVLSSWLTCLFVLVAVFVFYLQTFAVAGPSGKLGNATAVAAALRCTHGHSGNEAGSMATIASVDGAVSSILYLLASVATVLPSQTSWQMVTSARPRQAAFGCLVAAVAVFALPYASAVIFGSGFVYVHGSRLDASIIEVVPVVMSWDALGQVGTLILFACYVSLAVMAASAHVLSVTAIIVCDIYQVYVCPFVSEDGGIESQRQKAVSNERHLEYERRCIIVRHISSVTCALALLPLSLSSLAAHLRPGTIFVFAGMLVAWSALPVVLCVAWHRLTRCALLVALSVGLSSSLAAWLAVAATRSEPKMFLNDSALLTALGAGLFGGGFGALTVSVCGGGCAANENSEEETWEQTRSIDALVIPWTVQYAADIGAKVLKKGKPHHRTVWRTYRTAEMFVYVTSVVAIVIVTLVLPAIVILLSVFSAGAMLAWHVAAAVFLLAGALLLGVTSIALHVRSVLRQHLNNRSWKRSSLPATNVPAFGGVYDFEERGAGSELDWRADF